MLSLTNADGNLSASILVISEMQFFQLLRENNLVPLVLHYLPHPLAVDTTNELSKEGILCWKEYNQHWYRQWVEKIADTSYMGDVNFGHAYQIALCAVSILGEEMIVVAGTTLDHICEQLVNWRQKFYHKDNDKEKTATMKAVAVSTFANQRKYLAPGLRGRIYNVAGISVFLDWKWIASALAYYKDGIITEYLANHLPKLVRNDVVEALYERREHSVLRHLSGTEVKWLIPLDTLTACMPDDPEIFKVVLEKIENMRPKALFFRCFEHEKIAHLEVMKEIGYSVDVNLSEHMMSCRVSRELFSASVGFFEKDFYAQQFGPCLYLNYEEGFVEELRLQRDATIKKLLKIARYRPFCVSAALEYLGDDAEALCCELLEKSRTWSTGEQGRFLDLFYIPPGCLKRSSLIITRCLDRESTHREKRVIIEGAAESTLREIISIDRDSVLCSVITGVRPELLH